MKDTLNKLKSRKLWIAIAAAATVALAKELGLDTETTWQIVTVAVGYVGGQAFVDAIEAKRK